MTTVRDGTSQIGPSQLARLLRLPEPTPEQAAVISAPLGPLAVIAGAGSGKSETMAARLVWLVANGMVRPDRVLGLTFTRKAAAEFADRVRSRLERLRRAGLEDAGLGGGPGPAGTGEVAGSGDPFGGDPVIGTYHAYAGRLVSDNALREGLEPSMRLITPALSWQLAAQIVAAYDGPMDEITWTPQTVTAAVLELAGDLSEHLRDTGDVTAVGLWLTAEQDALPGRIPASVRKIVSTQRAREQLLPLVSRYAAAKAAREVLDHSDQVALAARIASRHPEVGAAERSRYQVVLLDEYQDTSHAQLVLLQALFGGGHPVTAVGDPCQSIYGWRGASAGNLRRFTADFPVVARVRPFGASAPSGPAPVLQLSTSFRNSAQVLDAAATIQEELRYEAPDVPRLVSAPDRSGRGAVACALLDTVLDEAEWVAAQVAALLASEPGCAPDGQPWTPGPDRRTSGVRPSDIAVLCRKRAQFVPLRHAIEARGIPVEVVGLGGLLVVPEVQDVVATLRVLHDAGASDALARLLTGPRWRIGPRNLVALGRRARALARGEGDRPGSIAQAPGPPGQPDQDAADALAEAITDLTAETGSLVEALDDLGEPSAYSRVGYARMHALAGELRRLRAHIGRPLADLAAEAERVLGLDIEVAARPGVDPVAARADLDAFTDVADAFTGEGAAGASGSFGSSGTFGSFGSEPTLGAFLAYLAAAQQEEFGLETGRVGESDSVKLLTVHAAKGLQWPAVFVPGLAVGERSQVFPARPRVSTRWTENARLIPFGLRGDAGDLPELLGLDASSLDSFSEACAARDLAEERRLMYVAATRAAFWLGCSGYWWGEGGTSRLGPSPFLEEVRRSGVAQVLRVGARARTRRGEPAARLGGRGGLAGHPGGPALRGGPRGRGHGRGRGVLRCSRTGGTGRAQPAGPGTGGGLGPGRGAAAGRASAAPGRRRDPGDAARPALGVVAGGAGTGPGRARAAGPQAHAAAAGQAGAPGHGLPPVAGAAVRPADAHRRQCDLFGPEDDEAPGEGDLAELRSRFEHSEWADRWPQAVEVPFETLVGDRLVRGRIDAVFADAPGGGYDVVDWKTGQPPRSEAERHAVSVQLAAYRLAWAALAGVPVAAVRAAFYYVAHDQTVRPADLLDEAGLAALIEQVPAEA